MLEIPASKVVYAIGKEHAPAATCRDGETVAFLTLDCFSNQIKSDGELFESTDWSTINPATGPLFVEGAVPGDTLCVTILDIAIAERGVMVAVPKLGALGHLITSSETRIVPIVDGMAQFSATISIPIDPMIGVIGTAPEGDAVPCGTPGIHGGNMDTRLIRKGARVYLPVRVPGALLAMGDLHAVMADGEVVVCGVEVAGRVTVTVNLLKEVSLPGPVLEDASGMYFIHSAALIDDACTGALEDALYHITSRTAMPMNEAGMLLSLVGHLQVSQVVDPLKTARLHIPAEIVRTLGIKISR